MTTLFQNQASVVHVPFWMKGELVVPPQMERGAIEGLFAGRDDDEAYIKTDKVQVVRERVVDRSAQRLTDEWQYTVMPTVAPTQLLTHDFASLVKGPYALTVEQVCDFLTRFREVMAQEASVIEEVKGLVKQTSTFSDAYLDWTFATLQTSLDTALARQMIDRELSFWGMPGSQFLDGWVELPSQPLPDTAWLIAQNAPWRSHTAHTNTTTLVRAMPTRQLHITAGNSPNVPFVSALRMLLTKSVGTVKLPMNVTVAGGLFAWLLSKIGTHPLNDFLSLVYWKGGDAEVEDILFQPNAFDRIIVWGAPGSVSAVQERALFTKTVTFNPRYGVSVIARVESDKRRVEKTAWEEVAVKAGLDVMIYAQNACNASFVQYVEGSWEEAVAYGQALQAVLAEWDHLAPPIVPPGVRGQLRRLRRGKYSTAEWFLNTKDGDFTSGVVVMDSEFDLLDHPLNRFVVVRPVSSLDEIIPYLHAGVSTMGVYPESARVAWRDTFAATGVTNILPLGQSERLFAGMPHDGMVVLSQLVEWKQA